jgi:hypothetical protein
MTSISETMRRCGLTPSVAQLAFCKSVLGEPLDAAELECWQVGTGRTDYPQTPFTEADLRAGRKAGKTQYVIAPLIIHRACVDVDGPGVYLVVAPSKSDQAHAAWSSISQQLQRGYPGLIAEMQESAGSLRLHSGNEIRIASANFRTLRGPRYKVVCCDEANFHYSDSPDEGGANPLEFILDAVSGGMITTRSPLLLLASTPWIKSGTMYQHWLDRDANPDRLVWHSPTLRMNPFANRELMERHRRDRGQAFYSREYEAEWGDAVLAWVDPGDVDLAVAQSMPVFPPRPEHHYVLALDPGRVRDFFGAAVAHREQDVVVVDWAKEWRPGIFGLRYSDVLPQIWEIARSYRVREIFSDQVDFGGISAAVPLVNGVEEFRLTRIMTGGQAGAELSDTTRALFANHKLLLPNQPGLADEFKRLADYLGQGGARDVRARKGHDDRSRACMLAIHQAFTAPHLHAPLFTYVPFAEPPADSEVLPRTEADLRSAEREAYFFRRGGASFSR